MVALRNNVSAGSTAHGFIYWTDGLVEGDIARGRATVNVSDVENGHLIPGRQTMPVWWAPMAEFKGNEAYGSTIGFRARYIHSQGYMGEGGSAFHAPPPQAYIDTLDPRLEDMKIWGNRDGVLLNYTARMSIYDSLIVGIGTSFYLDPETMNTGPGLDLGTEITESMGRIENVTIEGFDLGFVVPRSHQWTFENLTLRNTTDMRITEARLGPRTITMNNITFGPLADTAVAGTEGQRRNIVAQLNHEPGFQPYLFVMPERITLDGQGLYFDSQAPGFRPLTDDPNEFDGPITVPSGYIGETNQQLFNRYGMSAGGAFPPPDAQNVPWFEGGVVGSPAPAATLFPPLLDMTSGGEFPKPAPGGPVPEVTGNRLEIRRGTTRTLTAVNLNTTDTNTALADLAYTVSNVGGGFFARRSAPTTAITTFTQAEVNCGTIRFVHDGSCDPPAFDTRVSDGQTTTMPSAALTRLVLPDGDTSCQGPTTTTTSTSTTTTTTSSTSTTSTTITGPTTTTTTINTTTTSTTTTTFPPGTCGNGIVENGEECEPDGVNACCTAGCRFALAATPCDDGLVCTGSDRCDGLGRCNGAPVFCDDGNPCTLEVCDAVSGCPVRGVAEPLPEEQCKYGGKVSLKLTDKVGTDRDQFQFKWSRGEENEPNEVGDFSRDGIHVCVFDLQNQSPVLAASMLVPGGEEWERFPADEDLDLRGWRLKDEPGIDGIGDVRFRAGPDDRSSFLIKGRGTRLPMPTPYSEDEYFAVDEAVIVQVHSASGGCWQGWLDNPRKNRGSDYRAPSYKE